MIYARVCRRRRSGQGLVEFVLVAPLLLLLIFGLVEFARGWNIRHLITDVAREGARNLAVDNPDMTVDSVTALIDARLDAAGMNSAAATVEVECVPTACADGAGVPGEAARVRIVYPYQLVVVRRLLGWAIGDATLNINSTFEMRNE